MSLYSNSNSEDFNNEFTLLELNFSLIIIIKDK